MLSHDDLSLLKDFTSESGLPVVSLYLDVNGAHFPSRADYEVELNALMRHARKTAGGQLGLSREQENALDADLENISQFINLEFRREGARGLALFSCGGTQLWQVLPLGLPVANRLFVDTEPRLAPLMEIFGSHDNLCVLATSKETARIFHVFAGDIAERTEILDSVPPHHDQGGWEQSKLQRWHDLEVRGHLKRAADATLDFFKREQFDKLLVGIADELWPELKKVLHPYLLERLAGRFVIDIGAPVDEVLAKAEAIETGQQQQEEQELLASLGPELSAGKSYAGGLDNVLALLNQKRVGLLVVESGYSEPGRRCGACQALVFAEETCPACGLEAPASADIVADAREMAVRQGARVLTVAPGHAAMTQANRIAARLRY